MIRRSIASALRRAALAARPQEYSLIPAALRTQSSKAYSAVSSLNWGAVGAFMLASAGGLGKV